MEKEDGALPSLAALCIQAVLAGDYWRVQRRQLAWLPEDGANALLAALLAQRRLEPPQLELFQHSVTALELDGAVVPGVGSTWLAYLGKFRALHELRLLRCARLKGGHLELLAPLAPTLRVLSLAGCREVTAVAAPALARLTGLESLDLTDTSMGPPTARLLTLLRALTCLKLGGLPVLDECCVALAQLTSLQRLELWGSEVTDEGVGELQSLSALTALDLSLTHCHCPPLLTALRALSMIKCSLDVRSEVQEALWLDMGATLPYLEELDLGLAVFSEPRGAQLLCQLAGGAGPSLRTLRLGASNASELDWLELNCTLTFLDLSGTPAQDGTLARLALLPLADLRLADTGISDRGVGQLLAMTTLTNLALRNTLVGDGALRVLCQLPALARLDLSGTEVAGNLAASELPGTLAALTSFTLLSSRLGDRGCKLLAAAAPALRELELGATAVTEAGLRALARLPCLSSLRMEGCSVSDPGLAELGDLASLRQLALENCWLVSEAGVRALLRALPRLEAVTLNGVEVALAASPARTAAGDRAAGARGRGRGRPAPAGASVGSSSARAQQRARGGWPASAGESPGGAGASAVRAAAKFGRLPEELLEYDERIRWSRDELLELRRAAVDVAEAAALLKQLPADLRTPARGGS